MKMTKAIQEYLADLKRAGKSPNTIASYEYDLDRFTRLSPADNISQFTPELVKRGMDLWEAEGKAKSSLHRRYTALRGFAKWGMMRTRRYWTDNPMDSVPTVRRPDSLPRPMDPDECARILALELPADEDMARTLLFWTGLRVTEVCSIRIGDVHLDTGRLRVTVKGGRQRVLELAPPLVDALTVYLVTRKGAKGHDTVLVYRNGRPLNRRTLERWANQWGAAAGVAGCTPHRFRHAFGSALLEQTGDLRLVQEAMGHRSIQSTTIYTRLSSSRLKLALADLPFRKKVPDVPPA